MKRVLLTVHKFFPDHRAGTEVLTLKVAQELMRRNYEVLVVTADPPDTDARHAVGEPFRTYEYDGVAVHSIGESLRLAGYDFSCDYYHPGIRKHFGTILDEFKPDLVHAFHLQNLSAAVIDEATERGIPSVMSATDFWLVCPIVQLKRPDGAMCRGPGPGGKRCLDCYTPKLLPPKTELMEAVARKYPLAAGALSMLGPLAAPLEDTLHKLYNSRKLPAAQQATTERPKALRDSAARLRRIMVATKLMQDIFIENGIPESLIQHVPFGIDTAPLTPFQNKTVGRTLRVGFIGTLFEHKGPDLLVDAFQMLPADCQAELLIYGDPQQFPEFGKFLEQRIRAGANKDKIRLCGTFPNLEFGKVLQNLDVLVVPSRWYENTPLVIQSSLATRTPLVAANLGGMAELIHHESNGLLFEPNDVHSLFQQLKRLVDDRALLKTLTQNIKPERDITAMVTDIEEVYREVLSEKTAQQTNVTGCSV